MKHIKKKITTWVLAVALIVGAMPVGVFASDYDNHWAKNAITKWSEKGIVKGYADGSFKPSKQVTRAELAVFIVRLFGLTDTKNAKTFADVPQGKWYASDVAKMSSAGLMYIEGNKFMPDQPATREEAAYALAKAYKLSGKSEKIFKDQDKISSWAKDAVDALFAKGYISGKGADEFAPKDILTRADVIAMIDKITPELINKAGTYTKDVSGNLVVNTRDVVLKDMTIKGNLYLAQGIGDGDITLEGITVEGKTFVEGGGINSIKSRDCKFYESLQVSANNPVRIVVQGDAVKIEALPGTTVTLTGNFKEVILTENVNVIVKDAQVDNIIVQPTISGNKDAKAPTIEIAAGSTVKQVQADAPVQTTGTGKIEKLIVNCDGVKVAQTPTATTIKNAEIKVEVAGKEQTQSTVNTPASGGGGGGGGSSSSGGPTTPTTPTTECQVKGTVTYNGEAVQYADVNIFQKVGDDSKEIAYTETAANGAYSFYVKPGQNYWIEAWLVDEDGYGYHTSKENITISTNPTTIDIELIKRYIADVTIEDSNGTPVREAKIVEHENKNNWWHTDNSGFIGLFLWEDKEYNYDVYVNDIQVTQITGIRREEDYITERPIILADRGLSDTINGTAVLENGQPAANRNVILEIMDEDKTTTRHSKWKFVAEVRADQEGKFSFSNIDTNQNYQIFVWDEKDNTVYLSKVVNALVADKVPLKVKQGYVLDLKVVDKNGVIISDADVKIEKSSNDYFTTSSWDYNFTRICYQELQPGKYVIQVTIGKTSKIQDLIIEEGKYYYQRTVEFPEVISTAKAVSFAVTGELKVLGETLVPYEVNIAPQGGGEERWEQLDANGAAELFIPKDKVKDGNFIVTVFNKNSLILYKENVTLTDSKTNIVVDLSKIPTHKLIVNSVTQVTTDGITFINKPVEPTGVFIEKEANNSFSHAMGELLGKEGTLPEGKYWIIALYNEEDDEDRKYSGWTWIDLNKDITNPQIKLQPIITSNSIITVVDQAGNPLNDVCIDIKNSQGVRRFSSNPDGEINPMEIEKNYDITITLGNGYQDQYTIKDSVNGEYLVAVTEDALNIKLTLIPKIKQ